ncbi:FAD-dependent oxidoreductase [Variovorax paradoxus]|uniref:FAD-dependent oxidoreductase n=1 Tax=Variovorax paradoxus TaxID=34073 RepID=UPI0029C88F5B|nr:FAD-dependent oxidoreductase [Variovorax paradoxus]WPH18126.1 FAD-dependent oxidoreductase [Variovorax paradoxus]
MHDLLIVGQGAAGLAAALSAKELAPKARIAVLDRMPAAQAGGNTRWSPSNMRMQSLQEVSPHFEEDMAAASAGRGDPAYFHTLAAQAPETLAWAQRQGVQFQTMDYFLKAWPTRIQPVGKGAGLLEAFVQSARDKGIEFIHGCQAVQLLTASDGAVEGIVTADGQRLLARAVVLACGGFQGNPDMMREQFGERAATLRPISPGTAHNDGEGIRMALAAGALASGDWDGMHIEPVDPRSPRPAALVLAYPYGIVVDQIGRRFFDEGGALVHETWEAFSRTVHFELPGSVAWTILDASAQDIPGYANAVRSEVPPVQADTIEALAALIGIDPGALADTVSRYNAACIGDPARFDASKLDGLSTAPGFAPGKSNWAFALRKAPFLAFPVAGAIVYTFGGLSTDLQARVLGRHGPVPGLYAAGEITGHFYAHAPNAVAVMRALVFGRIAGRNAIQTTHP